MTYLLHEHDEERALGCAAVALDTEELFPKRLALTLRSFDLEQFGRVVHIASSLDFVRSKSARSPEGFCPSLLFHVPTQTESAPNSFNT